MVVDDTAVFRRLVTGGYTCITQLENDVKRFQTETATCFYRCAVVTAAAHKRRCGVELPSGCAYKFIQYRCVHSMRSNCNGKRYRCYNCKARFSVVLKGRFYEIGRYALVHSHDFHVGNPWLYAPNRRLTLEQETAIRTLMSTFRNTKELQHLIASQYGRHVNRFDLLNIRRRPRKVRCIEAAEVVPLASRRAVQRQQQVSGLATKVHESREVLAGFTTQLCSYGANNTHREVTELTPQLHQSPIHRQRVNERAMKPLEPQEVLADTAIQLCSHGAQNVRTEVVELTPPSLQSTTQRQQVNDRATKVHESQEVLADIATHLCSYSIQNFRKMVDALKMLRDVMSMEADITLYCSTPKYPVPLPLNGLTDLRKLKGIRVDRNAGDQPVSDDGHLVRVDVSAVQPNVHSGCNENLGSTCLSASTNRVSGRSSKRKAPLTLRVT